MEQTSFPGIGSALQFITEVIGKDVIIAFLGPKGTDSFYKDLQRLKAEDKINLETIERYLSVMETFFADQSMDSLFNWLKGDKLREYFGLYQKMILTIEPSYTSEPILINFIIKYLWFLIILDYCNYHISLYSLPPEEESDFPQDDPF